MSKYHVVPASDGELYLRDFEDGAYKSFPEVFVVYDQSEIDAKDAEIEALKAAFKSVVEDFNKSNSRLKIVTEALEYVAMPITSKNPTIESLLETIEADRFRAIQALKESEG